MDETFEIPVVYKDEQLYFPARLIQAGYTHRFDVTIGEHEIQFEPDEEGRYRALMNADQLNKTNIDIGLLEATAEAIESLV